MLILPKDIIVLISKTELDDRILYYDGDTVVSPNRVLECIDLGLVNFYVTEITPEIEQFNRLTSTPIKTKTECRSLTFEWNIPAEYKTLNVEEYLEDKLDDAISKLTGKLAGPIVRARVHRMYDELELYEKLDLIPILRVIIYIINTLTEKNIVWGVGRGSSVSSYVLYLIGVHDVDSVKYKLDIFDFLRTGD